MPQLDIVCATWNTENRSPENPEIIKFYEALWKKRKLNAPDFVVIGLQETAPDNGEWVADMCLRMAASGMKPIMDDGKPVKGPSIKGKTKWDAWCYQHIGIMQRSDSPWRVLQIKQEKNPKPGITGALSEKGAVALVVDIEGPAAQNRLHPPRIRLCFMSTHLNAGEGQAKELDSHIAWLTSKAKVEQPEEQLLTMNTPTNIHFVMGDLNFRLTPMKHYGEPQLPDIEAEAKDWAEALEDPARRKDLFQFYDGFNRLWLQDHKEWHAPAPETIDGADVCWPTYKRLYKDATKANACIQTIRTATPKSGAAIDAIKELYNLTDETITNYDEDGDLTRMKMNPKRKVWDLGWLDRILYSVGEEKSAKVNVQKEDYWDCFDMVQSDHTPVFLYFKANAT